MTPDRLRSPGITSLLFLSSKAVKFDPIKVKEGDSFAVQSLGREKVGGHKTSCFSSPKQLGSVRSKEFGTQLLEVFDSPAV